MYCPLETFASPPAHAPTPEPARHIPPPITAHTAFARRRARLSDIGCLVVLLALISPRLALVALWLFGDLLSRAYDSWALPLIGFFLLPWTTLAYAGLWSSGSDVEGFEWFLVGLGFLFDVGALGGGSRTRGRG